jgi:hypothetical protein
LAEFVLVFTELSLQPVYFHPVVGFPMVVDLHADLGERGTEVCAVIGEYAAKVFGLEGVGNPGRGFTATRYGLGHRRNVTHR